MNRNEVDVPPDVPGLAKRMEEVTGYDIELLLLQILYANQPHEIKDIKSDVMKEFLATLETVPSVTTKNQMDSSAKLPFWFHLDPNNSKILQKLKAKYENRISDDTLIELILRFSLLKKKIMDPPSNDSHTSYF